MKFRIITRYVKSLDSEFGTEVKQISISIFPLIPKISRTMNRKLCQCFKYSSSYLHVFTPISLKLSKISFAYLSAYILLNQIQKLSLLWIKRAYGFQNSK